MDESLEQAVRRICEECGNDRTRLVDVARAVQARFGCVCSEATDRIAERLGIHRVEVESCVSFYSFLSTQPKGEVVIRLCDDIIDEMKGSRRVARAFRRELGIDFGETTPDGKISLEWTPCIGMSDQAPAALVNDVVVTWLSSDSARRIVRELREHMTPQKLIHSFGEGNNAHELVRAMVDNNIRQAGPVIFAEAAPGDALGKALAMSPAEVIREVKTARLRGRGGAGFPTGMKWDFTRGADGDRKYVICNADEGEPGTFKDRVILTERAELLFEGMAIAGYAVGADTGILYLRGEYAYLKEFLEHVLADLREKGLLGGDVCGRHCLDFDIRIQMGAGSYECGEETALINSCEGRRGDPRTRPPFPAQKGYLGRPTVVNNVETLCCAARILEKGSGWFAQIGSRGSPGTKLLSISGDCSKPGVFEVPLGVSLRDVLDLCGARDPKAVQMGGPSGQMIGEGDFDRAVSYDDLATGGSVMVFSHKRDILKPVRKFMQFFVEESCGYCTPCRVGNVLLLERLERIMAGKGEPDDLGYLERLGETIKTASRCGLGQTSPNPILSSLRSFRVAYEDMIEEPAGALRPSFDVDAALAEAKEIAGRDSTFLNE
ncbi:MAG: NAD(P)H-dependent oxidoreductase subunit E [Planctomycetota bacterium]